MSSNPPFLNPENGQPVPSVQIEPSRLFQDGLKTEEVEVPVEILGTTVTDKASGFTGMAVGFVRHINGCFHVIIQPEGTIPKTNSLIARRDFDLRHCTGDAIRKMEGEELVKSRKETPSPEPFDLSDGLTVGTSVIT